LGDWVIGWVEEGWEESDAWREVRARSREKGR
jgi:hypothetical protein